MSVTAPWRLTAITPHDRGEALIRPGPRRRLTPINTREASGRGPAGDTEHRPRRPESVWVAWEPDRAQVWPSWGERRRPQRGHWEDQFGEPAGHGEAPLRPLRGASRTGPKPPPGRLSRRATRSGPRLFSVWLDPGGAVPANNARSCRPDRPGAEESANRGAPMGARRGETSNRRRRGLPAGARPTLPMVRGDVPGSPRLALKETSPSAIAARRGVARAPRVSRGTPRPWP